MKAAVIDRLLDGRHVDANSVLISEMTVANWTRRADIVLANGKLWAFEIKSEVDRLSRLPGQLATFATHFEKLVVVVAARFEEQAKKLVPDGVGLWVEEEPGQLKERIRPKVMPLKTDPALSLMTATDLRCFLACNGVKQIKDAPRAALEGIARDFPVTDLANAARDAVKRRYRCSHQIFIEKQARVGTFDAVHALRRFDRKTVASTDDAPQYELPEVELAEGHPLLVEAPAGRVLKRRRRA
ncbi:sce7726 family protein [Bradyrhizobium sp. USDA 3311]